MNEDTNKTLSFVLRAFATIPAGIAAGWFAFVALNYAGDMLTQVWGFGVFRPVRDQVGLVVNFLSYGLMGYVFSAVVFSVSPAQKKLVTYISSGIAGSLALLSSGIALAQGDLHILLLTLPLLAGLTLSCYGFGKEEG